jgi:hypothetical protein
MMAVGASPAERGEGGSDNGTRDVKCKGVTEDLRAGEFPCTRARVFSFYACVRVRGPTKYDLGCECLRRVDGEAGMSCQPFIVR